MKRIITGILALLLVCSAGIPRAYAAGCGYRRSEAKVCGTEKSCSGTCQFVDADGDGICDNCKTQWGSCENWQDADGDGICDSCTGVHRGQGSNGCSWRSGGRSGRHCGRQ